METYSYRQVLPSCNLNRELLASLEKRLLLGIPKLLHQGLQKILKGLGLDSHKKLESYRIVMTVGKKTLTVRGAQEMAKPYFEPKTSQVRLEYSLGAPRILVLAMVFPRQGQPSLELSTQSPQLEKLLPKIAEGLIEVVGFYGNRHKLLHNPFIQAVLLFSLPMAVMGYGLLQGIDLFLLYTSMGWLCLLSLGLIMSLPQLFPWVTFESRRRFQWRRLPLLARVSVLSVAAGCYAGMVLLLLPTVTL